MPDPTTTDYEKILIKHGLRSHASTDAEKAMAAEILQLRGELLIGDASLDARTLHNVRDQQRRVVQKAIHYYHNPEATIGPLFDAVAALLRITGGKQHGA